jgi:hypothetical protein
MYTTNRVHVNHFYIVRTDQRVPQPVSRGSSSSSLSPATTLSSPTASPSASPLTVKETTRAVTSEAQLEEISRRKLNAVRRERDSDGEGGTLYTSAGSTGGGKNRGRGSGAGLNNSGNLKEALNSPEGTQGCNVT